MQVNASTYSKVEQTNKIQTVSMEDRKRFLGMFRTPLRVAPAYQYQLPGASKAGPFGFCVTTASQGTSLRAVHRVCRREPSRQTETRAGFTPDGTPSGVSKTVVILFQIHHLNVLPQLQEIPDNCRESILHAEIRFKLQYKNQEY